MPKPEPEEIERAARELEKKTQSLKEQMESLVIQVRKHLQELDRVREQASKLASEKKKKK